MGKLKTSKENNTGENLNPNSMEKVDGGKKYSCTLCPYSTSILQHYKDHKAKHSTLIEKPFKCPECPFRSKWESSVKNHVKNIHIVQSPTGSGSGSGSGPSRPFPCPHSGCNYAAKQKSDLKSHSKIHSDEKSLVCAHPNCKYSTNSQRNLIVHIRTHTGAKPFACQFESCSYATASSGALVLHSRTHTKERPYKCLEPNCEYSATQPQHIKRHQLYHHPKPGDEEKRPFFPCPLCEYTGKTNGNLSEHVKSHTLEKLYKCDEPNCNFAAKRNSELKVHKLKHSAEKPFACSFESCQLHFKSKHTMKNHLKTHGDKCQYKCELCPYRAKTRTVVINHINNVHSEIRRFKCKEPQCGSAFKRKEHLKMHLMFHNGEKNYSCSFPDCEYKAVLKSTIKQHEKVFHAIEKAFKCPLCDFVAKGKRNVDDHVKSHTKEQPFSCPEPGCGYRAKQLVSLKKHETQKHPWATQG